MFSFGKNTFKRTRGGVTPGHFKNTRDCATEQLPIPDTVRIPMAQHIGAPCQPTVKVGDTVAVGTVIGLGEGFMTAPIHASVSGKVKAIEDFIMPTSARCKAVVIAADKLQTPDESVTPPDVHDFESFIAAVKQSGLVGLGGAGFPTWIKLSPKNLDQVDTLIINGAECEPYLTSDYRECLESPDTVIEGVQLVKKYLNLQHCYIGIEKNKPEAIAILKEKVQGLDGIEIKELATRYPQGAEKVIISEITGRRVPMGKLPADVGVVVLNITSTSFIARYLRTGMPLVAKRVTVDGDCVKNPGNWLVPIGTAIADVAEACGGCDRDPAKILLGGPMMGTCVYADSYPVAKNTNGLLFFSADAASQQRVLACMKCGRCASVCPMGLMPPQIYEANKVKDIAELTRLQVNACMECGCCSYICPSKRLVTQSMREAKATLRAAAAKKQ